MNSAKTLLKVCISSALLFISHASLAQTFRAAETFILLTIPMLLLLSIWERS